MLTTFSDIPERDRVIVALDCDIEEAFELADKLQGKATWMKIGMTLFYANGPAVVYALKERGFKVFLDLKFHDIPHQVEGAAYSAAASGADMMTLGITVLTSMSQAALADTGVTRPMSEQVNVLAEQAKRSGISGVVASPQEAAMLREVLGPEGYIVTPGVRPAGSALGDQSRVATPKQAFENGASHIVIGRPITQAVDPAAAFDAIVAELD